MRRSSFYTAPSNYFKALLWCQRRFKYVFGFQNNGFGIGFEVKIFASNKAIAIKQLDDLPRFNNPTVAGFVGYDIKNQLENLTSQHLTPFGFPDLGFIDAEVVFYFKQTRLTISSKSKRPSLLWNEVVQTKKTHVPSEKYLFDSQTNRASYNRKVDTLREHMRQGDIYEACLCTEHLATPQKKVQPIYLFEKLCRYSPKPFASFVKWDNQYLIGASPERYLKLDGDQLMSQPIKGTIERGKTPLEDQQNKETLHNDPKERAENLMIVDLVRNDLARTSKLGSIKVKELFGIYTFPNVHQMISTITSTILPSADFGTVLKASFPMGSMTGAPKIKAMQIIEEQEDFKRGLYSGTVGYFTETGFDFNVVIRSLQYNADKNTLGYHVGSAITYDSDANKEYDECALKAKSILRAIK